MGWAYRRLFWLYGRPDHILEFPYFAIDPANQVENELVLFILKPLF